MGELHEGINELGRWLACDKSLTPQQRARIVQLASCLLEGADYTAEPMGAMDIDVRLSARLHGVQVSVKMNMKTKVATVSWAAVKVAG